MMFMRRLRILICMRRVEIDEVIDHAPVLARRHESRSLRAWLRRFQLRDANHQRLDLLVAAIPVSSLVIMMILGLLPLAIGHLVKISGTINGSALAGLWLRRRCSVGGPHLVPPPIGAFRGRGRA